MSSSLKHRGAVLTAALAGMVASVLLFYPGWMSHDSAVQYAQALGTLPMDDVHPPLFALLWRATGMALPAPSGLFLLFVLLWWLALAAIAAQCLRTPWRAAAATLLVGGWPAALLMLAPLGKDVAMAVALLLAVAAILAWRRGARPWAWAGALLALAAATAFRHSGVFAALPLLVWLLWPRSAVVGPRARWRSGTWFLPVAWRRCRLGGAVALAASSWGTALPLLLISGSAEFRYLLWTVLAALLAWVWALGGPRPGAGPAT